MVNLSEYLENRLCNIISSWEEDDIYAISFLVYANESYEYKGYPNVTEFSVGYNTESACGNADKLSEQRWNCAFWLQNEIPIISPDDEDVGMQVLFDWYAENGIDNIGYEDFDACYDDEMQYIGKGPVGYYELLSQVAAVAKKLQDSGFIKNKFKSPIPIIIHDFEYPWYIIEANKTANPNGEAEVFFEAMKELGFTE